MDNAMVIRHIFRGGGSMISAWHSSLSEEKKDTVGGTQESKLLLYGQILAGRNAVAIFIPPPKSNSNFSKHFVTFNRFHLHSRCN